ncbi:MAG: hypothetical protein K2N06_05470 [Oscillospiraceae bacterium]|nr:hypothetical protein [Oscillospiraceae bacterium]
MADFESIIKNHISEGNAVTADAIAKLTKAISTAVGNEFVEKSRYKAKLEEIDSLKAEKQTAEDSATTAEKWKAKHDALKEDFERYKGEVSAKETRGAKEKAYRALLKEIGVVEKSIDSIIKVTNFDDIKLDKDGNISDRDTVKKSAQDAYGGFISTNLEKKETPETPPTNGGKTPMTRDQIMKIKDTSERQAAIAENLELFGG